MFIIIDFGNNNGKQKTVEFLGLFYTLHANFSIMAGERFTIIASFCRTTCILYSLLQSYSELAESEHSCIPKVTLCEKRQPHFPKLELPNRVLMQIKFAMSFNTTDASVQQLLNYWTNIYHINITLAVESQKLRFSNYLKIRLLCSIEVDGIEIQYRWIAHLM